MHGGWAGENSPAVEVETRDFSLTRMNDRSKAVRLWQSRFKGNTAWRGSKWIGFHISIRLLLAQLKVDRPANSKLVNSRATEVVIRTTYYVLSFEQPQQKAPDRVSSYKRSLFFLNLRGAPQHPSPILFGFIQLLGF